MVCAAHIAVQCRLFVLVSAVESVLEPNLTSKGRHTDPVKRIYRLTLPSVAPAVTIAVQAVGARTVNANAPVGTPNVALGATISRAIAKILFMSTYMSTITSTLPLSIAPKNR